MDDTVTTSWKRDSDTARMLRASPGEAPMHARILIVDNDIGSAHSLELMLHASGYLQSCVAYSGGAALAMAVMFQPSVVLLDIDLLDMSGYELAQSLLAQAQRPDLRLVALISGSEPAASERARAAGFDRHLLKPVTARSLPDLIESLS